MPLPTRARMRDSAGQTTAEYALVILAAAALATMVIAWATKRKYWRSGPPWELEAELAYPTLALVR